MTISTRKTVSFPVVVWYAPETGEFQIERPTDTGFSVRVSDDPGSVTGHPQLYKALRRALRDKGVGFEEGPARFN